MRLERLLDFFGEDLLPARVDGGRPPAQQVDGPVGVDLGEVAGDGVAHAVDLLEGAFGLLLVLVVPERVAPAERQDAHLVGPGLHRPAVVGEHLDVRTEGERRRLGRRAAGRDRHTHAQRLGRAEGVDEEHPRVVGQEGLLHRLTPHGPRGNDHHERAQVPPAGSLVQRGQQRAGEGIAHP